MSLVGDTAQSPEEIVEVETRTLKCEHTYENTVSGS